MSALIVGHKSVREPIMGKLAMLSRIVRLISWVALVAFAIVYLVFAIIRDLVGLVTGATYRQSLALLWVFGVAYEFGRWATGTNRKQRRSQFQKLITEAENGDAEAQHSLARSYRFGIDPISKDPGEAVKWCRRAAENGHAEAQTLLGEILLTGKHSLQEAREAACWFQKAAEQGHSEAQSNLANAYFNGHGVPQDYTAAILWYSRAAEQCEAKAQFSLARIFAYGTGVECDYVKALMWCDIALSCETPNDDLGAPGKIPTVEDMLLKRMQHNDIERAYQLAQLWLKRHGK